MIPALQIYWLTWFFPCLIILIPKKLFYHADEHKIIGHERLAYLRKYIDFIKFILLGFSLIGALDIYRSHLYIIVPILIVGLITQIALQKLHKEKYHIKYSLISLQIIILSLGISIFYIPFPFWGIIGYFILGIWEDVYFEKNIEGFLKREQFGILLSALLCLIAHFFTPILIENMLIGIIVISLSLLTFLIFQKYQFNMCILLFVGISIWGVHFYIKIQQTNFSKIFYTNFSSQKNNIDYEPLIYLFSVAENQKIKTNIIDDKLLLAISNNNTVISFNPTPILLTSLLNKNNIYILNLQKLSSYNSSIGSIFLKNRFCKYVANSSILFINTNEYIYCKDDVSVALPPISLNNNQKSNFYNLTYQLAQLEENEQNYILAFSLYTKIYEYFKDDIHVIRKLASVSGKLGKIDEQIYYMEELLLKNNTHNYTDYINLIEIYFWKNNYKKARELCKEALNIDTNHTFQYLKWLEKILSQDPERTEIYNFLSKVKQWNPKNIQEKYKQDELINNTETMLQEKPLWSDDIKEKRTKETKLILPR